MKRFTSSLPQRVIAFSKLLACMPLLFWQIQRLHAQANFPCLLSQQKLIDCLGHVTKIAVPRPGKKKITYDLEGIPPGVYFLKISGPYINQSIKIQLLP